MTAEGSGGMGGARGGWRPRVWAPRPKRVELVADGGRPRPMEPLGGGWWEAEARLPPGTDYAFLLDGEGPFPDPRSRHQPEGVHGPSRVVDPDTFSWTTEGWGGFHLPSAVLYELHPGTFSPEGTFDGAIRRLDHLVELGVDAVSLMPVNAFPGEHGWGYDGAAIWAVHEPYGGPEGLVRFVDACHARGLGVILDVVYNHLGPDGNYLGLYGPYFTDRYDTPWGDAVNFDQGGSDEVRRFFLDNALAWLRDYRLDGLRLDAVHAILDTSAVHVLEELALRVEGLEAEVGRPLWLVAESDLNDPRLLWSRERGGYGLDAQWSDDFHHALHAALTGESEGYYGDFGSLSDVAAALRRAYVYDGRHSRYRGRRHGRPAEGLRGWRFLGYSQNHDQVGNRAAGDRLPALVPPGLLRVAAGLVLTSPFVPMLFQGEEWGATTPFQYFTDHQDEELGRAVREGRRREFAAFGWDSDEVPDPQDPGTFRRSKLDWAELQGDGHRGLFAWYQALVALRRREPALTDGRLDRVETAVDEEARTLAFTRGEGADRLVVLANLSGEERRVAEPDGPAPGGSAAEVVLASREGVTDEDGPAGRRWVLPAASFAVVR